MLATASETMTPIAPLQAACKCCGAIASIYGVVDFHKNNNVPGRKVLPPSGIPIYYHRCPACGFLFSIAYDHFTQADFSRWIYNSEYGQIDPHYAELRPTETAKLISNAFRATPTVKILDYGGGNGLTAQKLRAHGFANAQCYDPFVPSSASKPDGKFELIICFEVLEHSPDPRGTLRDMIGSLDEPGVVIFSTLFQPQSFDQLGMSWWYILPRNGHVSLYSRRSMSVLTSSLGYTLVSFGDGLHAMYKQVPAFARHLIR